jgi:phenylacetate-CoA ligase
MGAFATYRAFRRLLAAQRLETERIRELQERKLRDVVRGAYEHVPYYRRLLDRAGISPREILTADDLRKVPISPKADLQNSGPDELLDRRFDRLRLVPHRSSGSTGRPFTVYYDPAFRAARDGLFLRALATAGYRPGRKLLLITGGRSERRLSSAYRWRYASIEDPPARHRDLFLRFRPQILYGCTTAIRLLAEELSASSERLPSLVSVVTTAETLDAETRRRLEARFGCPVFDFYGLTETGLVGWECAAHDGYHLAEESTLVEAIPLEGGEASRLVMTSLELRAMPIIRYDSGDVGLFHDEQSCSCGRRLRRLKRIEGRLVDCVTLRNGRRISPYRLTCALESLTLPRYQVIQEDPEAFTVRVESAGCVDAIPIDRIREALRAIVGPASRISVQPTPRLVPAPGRKFRVVESRLERHLVA